MSSFFSMFANPRKAYATLAPDIQALVISPCNIRAGAGKIPFIAFDLAGGGNIAGSNALVGGAGGQLDFLTTAGYNKLGLPGNMIPNSSVGAGNFVDTSLGLAMHSDSAYLRGIKQRAPRRPRGQRQWRGHAGDQPERHQSQSAQSDVRHSLGRRWPGDLLVLIGTEATASGGNSMAPAYMIDPTVQSDRGDAGLGRHRPGQYRPAGRAARPGRCGRRCSSRSSASAPPSSAQVSTDMPARRMRRSRTWCNAATSMPPTWWIKYGNALHDARSDLRIPTSPAAAASSAPPICRTSDFLATASVMKMVVNGYAGAGTIETGRLRLSRRHPRHRRDARLQGRAVHRRLPGIRRAHAACR